MEREEETLATIPEEKEDDDEGTAMPDVKNNCKIKTKGSSSDSSDASDADSDSDSEVEAKQNMALQTLRVSAIQWTFQLRHPCPSNFNTHIY